MPPPLEASSLLVPLDFPWDDVSLAPLFDPFVLEFAFLLGAIRLIQAAMVGENRKRGA